MSRPNSIRRPAARIGLCFRTTLAAAALASLFATSTATAAEKVERSGGPTGVGIVLGDTNGLSIKTWMGQTQAFHIRLGADGSQLNSMVISGTYEHHVRPVVIADGSYSLPFYVGGGVRGKVAAVSGNTYLDGGLVGVLGMSVLVRDLPVELFVEVRPQALLFNGDVGSSVSKVQFGIGIEGGMGANYYF